MLSVVHVLSVGTGTMVLMLLANGAVVLYGCRLADNNKEQVLDYLRQVVPLQGFDIFVYPGGDPTQISGLPLLQKHFTVEKVWEPGPGRGGDPLREELEYLALKRNVREVSHMMPGIKDFGASRLRVMAQDRGPQGRFGCGFAPVLKLEHLNPQTGRVLGSMLLAGPASGKTWEREILPANLPYHFRSSVLVASQSGHWGFFNEEPEQRTGLVDHIQAISPAVTVISVGEYEKGLPDKRALRQYRKYSTSLVKSHRIVQTCDSGHVVIRMRGDGVTLLSFTGATNLARH